MAFLVGTTMQAIITLHHPDYIPEAWHGTLLVIALILAAFVFNVFFATQLPVVQGLVFVIHVCGLFAIAVPLWVLSPRKPANEVFTEFTNNGGWSSMGLSFMVGFLPISASLGGIDCVVHMGESIRNHPCFARPVNNDGIRGTQLKKFEIRPGPCLDRSCWPCS